LAIQQQLIIRFHVHRRTLQPPLRIQSRYQPRDINADGAIHCNWGPYQDHGKSKGHAQLLNGQITPKPSITINNHGIILRRHPHDALKADPAQVPQAKYTSSPPPKQKTSTDSIGTRPFHRHMVHHEAPQIISVSYPYVPNENYTPCGSQPKLRKPSEVKIKKKKGRHNLRQMRNVIAQRDYDTTQRKYGLIANARTNQVGQGKFR